MGSQLIVGYNDTAGGADALALALALSDSAIGVQTTITVAVVSYLLSDGIGAAGIHGEDEERLAQDAEARLAGAREICGDRPGASFVVRPASSPARGLQRLADELDGDLLIVGRSHTGPLGRAFLGSVTEQALHGAGCPVAVAPVGYAAGAPHAIATIAVAFDGSDESEEALTRALHLARERHAALRLVRVVEPVPMAYGEVVITYTPADQRADAERALTAARERIVRLEVETSLLDGDPVRALSGLGATADLLVMGSRGFGPIGRVLLGGVSARLSRHCPTPLIVVPRTTDGDAADDDASAAGRATAGDAPSTAMSTATPTVAVAGDPPAVTGAGART